MQGKIKVSCPYCKNGRLMDVVIEDQTGTEKIDRVSRHVECVVLLSRV